ncbi:MAG TPA: hypothetical protein VI522_00835 [Gammaproteobacteria bacterium]|nr:hypothetical protein [Gammaproteobacteria bacterium]
MSKFQLCVLGSTLFSLCTLAYAEVPITNCEELQNIPENSSDYFYLTRSISCEGLDFTPIDGKFSGTLDGRGFIITNLT